MDDVAITIVHSFKLEPMQPSTTPMHHPLMDQILNRKHALTNLTDAEFEAMLPQLAAELERLVPGLRVHDADVTPENLGSVARIVAYLQRQP